MKLISLNLENWALHDAIHVSLKNGLQIEGRNGTGKSSILEAIRFIFSEKSRGYKGKVKKGRKEARIVLKCEKEEEEDDKIIYLIEKVISPPEKKSAVKARMFRNREEIADNATSVSKRLSENMISEELFEKLCYVPQGKLTDILDRLKVKGGRQELDSLLGLDRLERVFKGAGVEILKGKERLKILSAEMEKYPSEGENYFSEEIEKAEKEKSILQKERENKLKEREKIEGKLKLLTQKITELEKTKKEKDALEEKLNRINLSLIKEKEELNSKSLILSSLKEKEEELKKLKSEQEGLKKYPEIKNFVLNKNQLDEQLKALTKSEESEKENIEELKVKLSELGEISSEFENRELQLKNITQQVAVLKNNYQEKKDFLESLNELDAEKKCPRCGQNLTEDHINNEKVKVENETRELKTKLDKSEKDLLEQENSFRIIRKKKDDFKKIELRLRNFEEFFAKTSSEKASIEKELFLLNGKMKSEKIMVHLNIREIDDKINRLNKIIGKISQIESDVLKGNELKESLPLLESSIEKLNKEKENLNKRISTLKEQYSEDIFSGLLMEKELNQEKLYKTTNELQNCDFSLKEIATKLEDFTSKKKEFLEKKENLKTTRKSVRILERAREFFHTDKGIPKKLRERYILKLNFLLTNYFRKLNQNPLYKKVSFNKNYELEIQTNDPILGILELSQISGGEKSQLAIAFRMALMDILSPVKLLILDEPFGNLDLEHREILGESLSKISRDGGQLIVVTHIPVETLQLPERLDLGGY